MERERGGVGGRGRGEISSNNMKKREGRQGESEGKKRENVK